MKLFIKPFLEFHIPLAYSFFFGVVFSNTFLLCSSDTKFHAHTKLEAQLGIYRYILIKINNNYCMPLDDGRMTETCFGNNIGRREELLR
jgi:hypothetical protein